MKIAYLSNSIIPSRRANSIHVMQIANALAKMGHDVFLYTPDHKNIDASVGNVFDYYGIPDSFALKKLFYPAIKGKTICYALATAVELRRLRPDLVVGRSIHGCLISALMGFNTVFDSHGPVWEVDPGSVRLFRLMVRQSALKRMTVNSHSLKQLYVNSKVFLGTNFNPENIEVAFNGANEYPIDEYANLPGRKGSFKAGYFGHLYAGRGMEIISEVARDFPFIDFYIGGGEVEDIDYWKTVCQSGNIYFLGHLKHSEVYRYRNSCDLLLAPYQKVVSPGGSVGDQSAYMNPIKILEYMSSQKPIIASDLPTIREVLNDENAILVSPDDLGAWACAIDFVYRNQDTARNLGERAFKNFIGNYTWHTRAQKLITNLI